MKKNLLIILVLLVTNLSFAQEQSQPLVQEQSKSTNQVRNGRQGFFLGFGVGFGGMHFDQNSSNFDRGVFLGNFRIGGGLNDKILLMGESLSSVTEENSVTTSVNSINFASQFFFAQNFYVRPGIGFSVMNSSVSSGSSTTSTHSDTGFSLVTSGGYEFRLGKSFVLSPELNLNYNYIDSANILNYGTVLGFLWYFK